MTYLAVAFGGALGAMSRYWVYNTFLKVTDSKFPFATLTVNIAGSFLIGIAFVLLTERTEIGPEWRGIVTVGFLGAFTTFSTFSYETVEALNVGDLRVAAANVAANLTVALVACRGGWEIGLRL